MSSPGIQVICWLCHAPAQMIGLMRVFADAQADLSLRWAHRSFCWFCHAVAHVIHSSLVIYNNFSMKEIFLLKYVNKEYMY